jgi:diguanylate cyclase (GGDEF)-like protein/PAS domain S-box-containing protein
VSKWIIDKAHSRVGFEVTHMMVSRVRGQFDSYKAEIEAEDPKDLTTALISFHFDTDSINTRIRMRDEHLKSADFLDVEDYPTIDFYSTEITKQQKEDAYQVVGDLTIKGITRQVEFDVEFSGKATDPSGREVFGYAAQTVIDREEFGLLWNTSLETGGVLVGKEVTVTVDLELMHEDEQPNEFGLDRGQSAPVKRKTTEEFYRLIAENLTDFIAIINRNGLMEFTSASLESVLDKDQKQHPNNLLDIVHPEEKEIIADEILTYFNKSIKKDLINEFRIHHKKGYDIHVEATMTTIADDEELGLIVMRDISERKEAENAIYHLAFHDSLTKLPNRRSFMSQLRNELMDRKISKSMLAILFIDLDDFKNVNDRWGHHVGDVVLKEAAKRIQSAICETDIPARLGGDEFVVMLRNLHDKDTALTIANRLLEQFKTPIEAFDQEITLTPSIGLAYYPQHGESADELMKNADAALNYVKEQGKSGFSIFNEKIEHQSLERRILENALRKAVREQQFYLEYQPKVNINTNEIIGMEALVRWDHPELGIIPPIKFIPLAEETGLIVPLGEWILKESVRQASLWQENGYPDLNLSVNISVRQLEDNNFGTMLQNVLEETTYNPEKLELEITESVLANVESMIGILKEVRELGVLISIDDFGTGYSSLSYIKDLPIDTIKIDRSFVKDIHTNKESKEITKALVNLANSIGLNAIAEGIELKEHVDELSEDGYTYGQGFYYSKPLKPKTFEELMERSNLSKNITE